MAFAIRSRATGVILIVAGVIIGAAYFLAPVPASDELERRDGVVEDVRRERTTPCRHSAHDCLHTEVDVRHPDGSRSYNFGQTDVDSVAIGEPIDLWVAPAIKGLDHDRVWQAQQRGRRIVDYERQARTDRRIIAFLVPLAPLLILGGVWMTRSY